MTAPVEVFPGDTLMLSRKVTEDWFLLKPTPAVKALVAYIVLYWADRYDIEVLAIIVLGNHLHVIYRHHGSGPRFCQMVDHWIARIMNERLGRTGKAFFAPGPCRPVRDLESMDVDDQLDYLVANAVLHGLSERAYDWPGLLFGPENVGETLVFEAPPELQNSEIFPASIEYVVPAPFHLRHMSFADIETKFVERREAIEAAEFERRDGRFMGVERAMGVPKFSRPMKVKKSRTRPFFRARNPVARAVARKSRRQFLKDYRERLEAFRDGDRTSDWPPGTYKMRKTYGLPP